MTPTLISPPGTLGRSFVGARFPEPSLWALDGKPSHPQEAIRRENHGARDRVLLKAGRLCSREHHDEPEQNEVLPAVSFGRTPSSTLLRMLHVREGLLLLLRLLFDGRAMLSDLPSFGGEVSRDHERTRSESSSRA